MRVIDRLRVWPVLGWSAFALSCLLVALGAVLSVGALYPEDAVLAIGFTAIGALMLSRQPGHRAGLICLTPVLAAAAYAATAYADAATGSGLTGGDLAAWAAGWLWVPGLLPALTVLLLVLPDGRLPSSRWRPVAWLVWLVIGLVTFLGATAPMPGLPPGPVEIAALAPLLPSGTVVTLVLLGLAVLCLASLIARWSRAGTVERAQLLWMLLGATVFVLGSLLNPALPAPWAALVTQGAALALPLSFGVAVLRHRLIDLNRWLQRLVLLVLLLVVLLGLFSTGRVLVGDGLVGAAVITVVAGLAGPIVVRVLAPRVDRLVYGRAGDPSVVLAGLARRLGDAVAPRDVLDVLADIALTVLPITAVRVALISGGADLNVVERVGPATAVRTVDLRFGDAVLGVFTVGGDLPLDDAGRSLLDGMAATASAAVAAAHRAVELQRSREDLVLAREQERRRIARDLHDGVGPVLSGLGFTLDALRVTLDDRHRAEEIAMQAAATVRDAVQLVRTVSTKLRPGGLDQLGLAGSLAELAAQHTTPDLRVRLDIPTGAPRPVAPAVEVAAYSIIGEALTNTARHAGATTCTITVRFEERAVRLSVCDDGQGLRDTRPGLGRKSMSERAAEIGGRCRIDSGPAGGTTVEAHLPDPGVLDDR